MNDKYLVNAIQTLKPNSEFVIIDNDYSNIEWQVLEGNAPTQAEINAEIEKIKAAEEQAVIDAQNAKAAAQAKLEALGLTAGDLAALGL
jgi:hypothetical protein